MLQSKFLIVLVVVGLVLLIDIKTARLIDRAGRNLPRLVRLFVQGVMWLTTVLVMGTVVWYYLADYLRIHNNIPLWLMTLFMVIYFSKAFSLLFILLDDALFGIRKYLYRKKIVPEPVGKPITRSQFLKKTALVAGALPFSASVFGIVHGAYDYRVRKRTIYLPNLPKAFDGIRIGQFSDVHCNPEYPRVAITGGVDLLMQEKPDVIFFTGDLVNFRTDEVDEYISVFDKVKAPLGVYSVTGNHDYGNYVWWPSEEAKKKNMDDFLVAHKLLGYDLLMNEHRFLEMSGEKIAIIGVENWGRGRFPKYGKLHRAYKGTEEAAVKLLLSHDPSHWDEQVRPGYPDIDVMFAGHTHGFQFGIEVGDFRWSPAQYSYKQWADLYQQGNQYLYVNRGFGCIGYLGRIGMPPELTIIELKSGSKHAIS